MSIVFGYKEQSRPGVYFRSAFLTAYTQKVQFQRWTVQIPDNSSSISLKFQFILKHLTKFCTWRIEKQEKNQRPQTLGILQSFQR